MISSDMQSRYISSALVEHNKYRKLHGVGTLKHNPELSKVALSWANHLAGKKKLFDSKNTYYNKILGENLYKASGYGNIDYGLNASKHWYSKVKDYNWSNPSFIKDTGNFTQVVWKDSKEFGLGVAVGQDGTVYCVANYFPAGNFIKELNENVFPDRSKSHESMAVYHSNDTNHNHQNNHFRPVSVPSLFSKSPSHSHLQISKTHPAPVPFQMLQFQHPNTSNYFVSSGTYPGFNGINNEGFEYQRYEYHTIHH